MRAITGLMTVYVVATAIAFSVFITSSDSTISNVIFAESAFALPMVIACFLGLIFRGATARRSLLFFEIGFLIFSLLVFISTFAGEHDAQYQLAVLVIPLIGFPAVAIAGVIAAVSPKSQPK
jgi:hypothetical protein